MIDLTLYDDKLEAEQERLANEVLRERHEWIRQMLTPDGGELPDVAMDDELVCHIDEMVICLEEAYFRWMRGRAITDPVPNWAARAEKFFYPPGERS